MLTNTKNRYKLNRLFLLFILSNIVFWTVSCLLFYPIDVLNNQLEGIGDGKSYVIASKWLYEDNFYASAIRPFFYPLLIGIPKLFGFEINRGFTFLLNYIFWITTVYSLYFFIKSFIKEEIAFVFFLIFTLSITFIIYLLIESLMSSLFSSIRRAIALLCRPT